MAIVYKKQVAEVSSLYFTTLVQGLIFVDYIYQLSV